LHCSLGFPPSSVGLGASVVFWGRRFGRSGQRWDSSAALDFPFQAGVQEIRLELR